MSTRRRLMNLQPDGTYRQAERVQIEANNLGSYTLRVDGRDEPYTGVGATWIDADNAVGEDVTVGFVQGESTLPVMFSRGSKPNAKLVLQENYLEYGTPWPRRGVTLQCSGHFAAVDVFGNSSTNVWLEGSVPATRTSAHIVRTYGGKIIIANNDKLSELDESTLEVSTGPTTLSGEIWAMSVDDAGDIWCVTGTIEEAVDCQDAYDAAEELAQDDETPYLDGEFYFNNPQVGGAYEDELANAFDAYLTANPVQSPYEACESEWESGLLDGYEGEQGTGVGFASGWVDAGGSI